MARVGPQRHRKQTNKQIAMVDFPPLSCVFIQVTPMHAEVLYIHGYLTLFYQPKTKDQCIYPVNK
jgi:hypothetical protein